MSTMQMLLYEWPAGDAVSFSRLRYKMCTRRHGERSTAQRSVKLISETPFERLSARMRLRGEG